jgi:fatty acid desaturase
MMPTHAYERTCDGHACRWSHTVAVPVAIVAIFASFTPMHDAVHYSVAPKNRALNDLVGRVAGVPLSAPFAAFRVIHLMHHRWCNDAASGPGGFSLDPDSYGGHGTVFTLPLKWATNMFYYFFYVGRLTYYSAHGGSDVVPNNIVQYRTETLVTYALLQLAKLWAASQLGAAGVVVYWSLCKVAAALLLIYSFDFLPHR